jgi:hypothetical protein
MTDAAVQEMFGSFGAFTLSFRGERLFCVTSTDRVWIMSALVSDGAARIGMNLNTEEAKRPRCKLLVPPSMCA